MVLFVLWVVGGALVVVWVAWASWRRRSRPPGGSRTCTAGWRRAPSARPLPPPYRPLPAGGVFGKARERSLADPMTWRDLAWLLVAPVVAFTGLLVVIVLLLAVVTGFIWWFATPPLMRARAAFDRWLLCLQPHRELEQRVQVLTETRAELVDHSAASCAGSSATCTTARRLGWWRSR